MTRRPCRRPKAAERFAGRKEAVPVFFPQCVPREVGAVFCFRTTPKGSNKAQRTSRKRFYMPFAGIFCRIKFKSVFGRRKPLRYVYRPGGKIRRLKIRQGLDSSGFRRLRMAGRGKNPRRLSPAGRDGENAGWSSFRAKFRNLKKRPRVFRKSANFRDPESLRIL